MWFDYLSAQKIFSNLAGNYLNCISCTIIEPGSLGFRRCTASVSTAGMTRSEVSSGTSSHQLRRKNKKPLPRIPLRPAENGKSGSEKRLWLQLRQLVEPRERGNICPGVRRLRIMITGRERTSLMGIYSSRTRTGSI